MAQLDHVADATAQKLKGKAQKAMGEYHQAMGKGVKGGILKAKGELNERIADAKLKFGRDKYSTADLGDEKI